MSSTASKPRSAYLLFTEHLQETVIKHTKVEVLQAPEICRDCYAQAALAARYYSAVQLLFVHLKL